MTAGHHTSTAHPTAGAPGSAGQAAQLPGDDPAGDARPGDDPPGAGAAVAARTRRVLDRHAGELGALLPVLHDLQAEFGFVPGAALPVVAAGLNLTRADVFGVLGFYRDLRREPAGRQVLRVCRAEACQAVGAEDLLVAATAQLGVEVGGTTADGEFTLEEVFCLGNCALGPSVQVGEAVHGRVDADRLAALARERA